MIMNQDEFYEQVKDRYGPTDLVDKLDIPMDELCGLLWEYILDNLHVFEDEFREFFEDE